MTMINRILREIGLFSFFVVLVPRERLFSRRVSVPRGEKTAASVLDPSFGFMGNPLILHIDSIQCGPGPDPEGESGFPAPRARYRSAGFRGVRQMRGIAGIFRVARIAVCRDRSRPVRGPCACANGANPILAGEFDFGKGRPIARRGSTGVSLKFLNIHVRFRYIPKVTD